MASSLIVGILGTVICFAWAQQLPRSETARRVIEQERDVNPSYHVSDEELSPRGLELRRLGKRIGWVSAAVFFGAFALAALVRS